MEKLGSDIDLVIDDGNHKASAQIQTAKNFLPLLQDDVVYVIEDVSDPERIVKVLGLEYFIKVLPNMLILEK